MSKCWWPHSGLILVDFDCLVLISQLKFRDVIPWATPNIAKTYDHENLWLPKLKIMMIDHIVNVTHKNPKAETHIGNLIPSIVHKVNHFTR
jgi:hypothetical protein